MNSPQNRGVYGFKEAFAAVAQAQRDASDAYRMQTTIDAMNDYTSGKISFERCAEIIGINFYELDAFCRERVSQVLTKEEG